VKLMRWWVVAALLAGCGGTQIAPPAVASDPGYPAGPYGYSVDDVLPDLSFSGKRVPVGQPASAVPSETISLGSLRAAGVRYLVVETAGAWCSDCAGDQPAMMQLEADYAPKGVAAAEVLLEGAYDAAASMDDVDGWSRDHAVSGTLLLDAGRAFEHAAGIIGFPSYFIVEAASMKIVNRTIKPLVEQPLGPVLDALLAKSP
jgi:hypothetical protein